MNACHKEYSLETGNTPSEGTLQDDGTGDCLPKNVVGAYVVGTTLTGTANYIEVQVNVTTIGTYLIYTDTVNGMHFRGSGIFTTMGLNTVRLQGIGTPFAAGISNFLVTYGTSSCTIAVTTVASLAVFTLNGAPGGCMGAVVAGTYTAGTALNASNTVTINVIVTTVGAYNISTVLSNGMIFSGSGVLPATGPQAIVLNGSLTPTTTGTTNIPVTVPGSSCSFNVTVVAAAPPATYTINCGAANVHGTYTVGTPLNAATNTVDITVDVTLAGSYTITGTAGGMTFAKSGTFAATGLGQVVTLIGSSGAGGPTTVGTNAVTLTGGTASCSFNVTVVAAAGAGTFAVICGSENVNGTYTAGTALTASNTVTVNVNVTVPGTYSIATTPVDGITFSASGTFAATGVVIVTLTSTSTPAAEGTFTVTIPGTTPCTFSLTVDPAAPSFGTWSFKAGTTTYSGTFFSVTLDNSTAPFTILDAGGDNPATDQFSFGVLDMAGGILASEQYNCASALSNSGFVYFTAASGTTYDANPSLTSNTMKITITSHNTTTKTIVGTFTGNAIINGTGGGTTPIAITNGAFTVTYP